LKPALEHLEGRLDVVEERVPGKQGLKLASGSWNSWAALESKSEFQENKD